MSGSSIQSTSDEDYRDRTHPAAAADRPGGPVACSCEFAIEPGGDIVVLRVVGEIDLLSLHILRDALSAAADRHPADLIVDLAGVAFCCCMGSLCSPRPFAPHRSAKPGLLSAVWPRTWTALRPCSSSRSTAFATAASPPAVHAIRVDHTHVTNSLGWSCDRIYDQTRGTG